MSKKTALPDELLDMVSGGTLSYRGNPATYSSVSTKGLVFESGGDSYTIEWTAEMTGVLEKNPGLLGEMDSAFKKAQADQNIQSIEGAFMEMFGEKI
jgi:hypothetical protein